MVGSSPKRRIAILGATGDQGFGLALRWAVAGESVIIGSRIRDKAEEAVRKATEILGEKYSVEGMENQDAVSNARIIILTVPFAAQIGIIRSVAPKLKDGDIFVDVTVPLADAVGGKSTQTLLPWHGSAAMQASRMIPKNVEVVAGFHNVVAGVLRDVARPVDCDVIICSDSKTAKKEVMELAEKISGVKAIDGGPLENARFVEQITPLLIGINLRYKVSAAGIRITGLK